MQKFNTYIQNITSNQFKLQLNVHTSSCLHNRAAKNYDVQSN